MAFRKGQAALDFLMTYGWAIALVVIIAAMLFALGIFDVSNFMGSKASGFSGVGVKGWKMDTAGTFTLKVTNQVGQQINVTGATVTVGTTTAAINGTIGVLSTGVDSGTLTTNVAAFGAQTSGSGYTAKVNINYTDMNSGFAYSTGGTLTGKAS